MNSMDLLKAFSDINEEYLIEEHEIKARKKEKYKEIRYKKFGTKRLSILKMLKPCFAFSIILFVIISSNYKNLNKNLEISNNKLNSKENLEEGIYINDYLLKNTYMDLGR